MATLVICNVHISVMFSMKHWIYHVQVYSRKKHHAVLWSSKSLPRKTLKVNSSNKLQSIGRCSVVVNTFVFTCKFTTCKGGPQTHCLADVLLVRTLSETGILYLRWKGFLSRLSTNFHKHTSAENVFCFRIPSELLAIKMRVVCQGQNATKEQRKHHTTQEAWKWKKILLCKIKEFLSLQNTLKKKLEIWKWKGS